MNINSVLTSTVRNNFGQQNKSDQYNIKENLQTTIQSRNDYISENEKRMKLLDEKYQKINEQNKKFTDPHGHIFDKYRNSNSPYFRSDLTKSEREAAYWMEIGWANSGAGGQYNFNDAIFRDEQPYDPTQDSIDRKIYNRQQVNNQIKSLLDKHNISIPEGTSLTITIDPNSFNLKITGLNDQSLINQIEDVLNIGDNAKELFFHIMRSRTDDSTQFSKQKLEKFYLTNQIKAITGYHLNELQVVDEKFVTENGTDIFEHFKDKLKMNINPYNKDEIKDVINYYGGILQQLAKSGFNSIPDLTLSILYKNDQLKDIGQSINYSEISSY